MVRHAAFILTIRLAPSVRRRRASTNAERRSRMEIGKLTVAERRARIHTDTDEARATPDQLRPSPGGAGDSRRRASARAGGRYAKNELPTNCAHVRTIGRELAGAASTALRGTTATVLSSTP